MVNCIMDMTLPNLSVNKPGFRVGLIPVLASPISSFGQISTGTRASDFLWENGEI